MYNIYNTDKDKNQNKHANNNCGELNKVINTLVYELLKGVTQKVKYKNNHLQNPYLRVILVKCAALTIETYQVLGTALVKSQNYQHQIV